MSDDNELFSEDAFRDYANTEDALRKASVPKPRRRPVISWYDVAQFLKTVILLSAAILVSSMALWMLLYGFRPL